MDALEDMLVFDAIICNTDRHYGNFGVLVDNKTNAIAAPAPLFDHGNSLDEVYLHPKATQMIEAFDSANQLVKDEVLALPEE